MVSFYPRILAIATILFVGILTSFCASRNFLKVNYKLPAEALQLKQTQVALEIKDIRENPTIATKSAKMALKNFSGHFALIVAQENKNAKLVGAFSLPSMIREIFKHRLEHAGVRVASAEESRQPVVEIILKEFRLDLINHKWVVHMTYQANLVEQNRLVGGETITGSAERLRVVGSKDAEMVIGDLISDVVNKLNLKSFFRSDQIQ